MCGPPRVDVSISHRIHTSIGPWTYERFVAVLSPGLFIVLRNDATIAMVCLHLVRHNQHNHSFVDHAAAFTYIIEVKFS